MSSDPQGASGTASFGFKPVAEEQRQSLVNGVFASVAERYDLMNDVMSGGLHRLWKDDLVTLANPPRGPAPCDVLDLAGGTGDVAIRLARASGEGTRVTICDISPEMLAVGRRKVADAGLDGRVALVEGNAEVLPFPDRSFDLVTIAFGIRNVTHIDRALGEARRVLRHGGRFLCLEFARVDVPGLDRIYDLYSFEAIPRLGQLFAGDAESYRYLVESIRRFPPQERFARMLGEAGLERVGYRNLTGGVAAIHWGWRL